MSPVEHTFYKTMLQMSDKRPSFFNMVEHVWQKTSSIYDPIFFFDLQCPHDKGGEFSVHIKMLGDWTGEKFSFLLTSPRIFFILKRSVLYKVLHKLILGSFHFKSHQNSFSLKYKIRKFKDL